MENRYRLSSNAFEREEEEDRIEPKKVFFLSVEGNATEREYFRGISKNRSLLGINVIVDVEVLDRSSTDTNSAPRQVIELLEEYIQLREKGDKDVLEEISDEFAEKYSREFIQKFLADSNLVPKKQRNKFTTDLLKLGYDINYRKYLEKYHNDLDEFAILIDRDMQTHSEANMRECIAHCKKKKYACYIVNPCFEFWLLLHLSDVKKEYADNLEKIWKNDKVSNRHTFVSYELSKKAHHGKSNLNFKKNYLPNIDKAVVRAKEFSSDENELVEHIGTNIWKLIEAMKAYGEKGEAG